MRHITHRSLSVLPLLALAAGFAAVPLPAAAAQGAPAVELQDNQYRILHLGLHAAELLAWEQCTEKERCQVRGVTTGDGTFLGVRADAATHERIVRALAREDAAPRTQVFQLLLIAANGPTGGAMPDNLPPGARKALQDLQGFLPYKSYRLLDSAWVPATSSAEVRLVGAAGASYDADLTFRRVGDSKSTQLFVERFRLREEGDSPALVNAKGERRAPRQLLFNSFDLDIGETIVVGTSRVDGTSDEALVVLLTAVAEPASP